MSDFVEGGETSAGKAVASDFYVSLKNLYKQADMSGEKYASYVEGLSRTLSNVQIMGMRNPKSIKELYVTLRFKEPDELVDDILEAGCLDKYPDSEVVRDLVQSEFSTAKIEDTLLQLGFGNEFFETAPEPVHDTITKEPPKTKKIKSCSHGTQVIQSLAEAGQSVVVAGPGAGKTTLLLYCALAHAGYFPAPKGLMPKIPVFLPLRDLTRKIEPRQDAGWLVELAANFASNMSNSTFGKEWIEKQLRHGNCLLLLDGLDEVEECNKAQLLQSISAFSQKYPMNDIVISCRKSAFRSSLVGFSVFEISPFTEADIKAFAKNWFAANPKVADKFIEDLEITQSARDICSTPLLVTLFCIMYEFSKSIPTHRAELYQLCIDALLFQWDTHRSVDRKKIGSDASKSMKENLLAKIARKTFDRHAYVFRRCILNTLIEDELSKLGLIGKIQADDLFSEIQDNHGLFVERGPNQISFSHLSFHEFFCAKHYVGTNQCNDLFQKYKADRRYREVLLLAIELSLDPEPLILGVISLHASESGTPTNERKLAEDVLGLSIPMKPILRKALTAIVSNEFNGVSDLRSPSADNYDERFERELDEFDLFDEIED